MTSFFHLQVQPRSLGVLGVVISLLWISNPDSARSDTLNIYFPPALGASTGLQTSTGGSLNGFVVRAGALTGTAGELISNLAGKTTSADILSEIDSSFVEYTSFSMTGAYLNNADQAVVSFTGEIFSCTAVDALGTRTGNYAVIQIDNEGNPTGTGGEISLIGGAIVGVTKAGSGYVNGIATIDGRQIRIVLKSMNKADFLGKDAYLLFYNNATASAATEIGIFRTAIPVETLDGDNEPTGQGIGLFPLGDDGFGGKESNFYFADENGILGPESYLNLLIGQYDSLNNRFTLGTLSGGIGQITSPLNVTNNSGTAFNYQITANNGANRYFATTNTSSTDLLTTTLPSWASVNTNTGVINFTTNSVEGSYAIRLVASNSLTASVATNTLNLVLQRASLDFTTTTNQITATAGVAITPFTFVATPGTNSYSVVSGNLFGLTLATNGTLSGIPNSAGINNVSVRASSGDQSATTTFNLAVASPTISVPSGELTGGQILTTAGASRTIPINKPAGFTSRSGTMTPSYTGVTFDGDNLVVSATAQPLPKGTDHVDVTLTSSRLVDGSTVSASTTVPLRVVAPVPENSLSFIESFTDANANEIYDLGETYVDSVFNGNYDSSIASSSLEVFVGEAYSIYFSTSASGVCPLQDFSVVSGTLPPGLLLESVGGRGGNRIYGINTSTTAPSDYTVTLQADTSRFYEGGGTRPFTITFRLQNKDAPYFFPIESRLLGAQGKYLKAYLSALNNPFKYEAANLPGWLSLKSNQGQWVLEGTPTSAGIFTIPITAYNSFRPGSDNPSDWNPGGLGTIVIHVAGSRPKNVALSGANNLKVGLPASFYLVPGGAEGAGVRVNVSGLPPGLVINRTTSQVTGTPTAKGSYPITVYIQNGKGWVKQLMTLTVGQ